MELPSQKLTTDLKLRIPMHIRQRLLGSHGDYGFKIQYFQVKIYGY